MSGFFDNFSDKKRDTSLSHRSGGDLLDWRAFRLYAWLRSPKSCILQDGFDYCSDSTFQLSSM